MNQAAFILAFLMVVAAPSSSPADADARRGADFFQT
jgi:hypothetical protein